MAMQEGVTLWTCDSPGCSATYAGMAKEPSGWGALEFQAPEAYMSAFPDTWRDDPITPKDDVGRIQIDLCPDCTGKVGEFLLFLLKDGTAKLPKRRAPKGRELAP